MTETDTSGGYTFGAPAAAAPLPAVPAAPSSPINTGIGTVVTTTADPRDALNCFGSLPAPLQAAARAEASKDLPTLMTNTVAYMQYGSQAIAPLNALVERQAQQLKNVKVTELQALMHNLNENFRAVQRGYDTKDASLQASTEKKHGWLRGKFREARSLADRFRDDMTPIYKQIQQIRAILVQKQNELTENVGMYDSLYQATEQELEGLIYRIAVMEQMAAIASEQAQVLSTQLDPTNQADPAAKRMAELTEFAANMQGKISEYKGRFFIGWSGAPRMLKMRSLDIGIALKLNEYDVSVIPMMQEIANLLAMQARSADATGLLEETSKSYNDMAVMLADKSAAGMANTARVLAAPTLKVETIQHIAAKFIEGTDNVLAAFQAGEIARGEAYEAMETSGKLISAQNQKISTQQIQSIIGSATSPLPLEITAG